MGDRERESRPVDLRARHGHPREGDPIDAVPFGTLCAWSGSGPLDLEQRPLARRDDGCWPPAHDEAGGRPYFGVEWDEPRDVQRVVVEVAPGSADSVPRVEYWRQNWPTPAPERRPGARRGWIGQDDPWHGTWVVAQALVTREGNVFVVEFDPIDVAEINDSQALEEAEHYQVRFRRTLKLRVLFRDGEAPLLRSLRTFTGGTWRRQQVTVHLEPGAAPEPAWDGQAEVYNGHLWGVEVAAAGETGAAAGLRAAAESPGGTANTTQRPESRTSQAMLGAPRSVRYLLLRADSPSPGDQTVVTVLAGRRSFSFRPAELDAGPIYVPDLGAYVATPGQPDYAAYVRDLAASQIRTIYDRVLSEPEQTAARAFAEVPAPSTTRHEPTPRYLPLGWDMNRQEFALLHNGHVFCNKRALKVGGRDTARLLWPGTAITYRFATGDPPAFREREGAVRQQLAEGYLPIVISTWEDREFRYEQTAFAAPIGDIPADPLQLRGDEDLVLWLRFGIRNRTEGAKRAQLWLAIEPFEELSLAGEEVIARGRVVPAAPVARQWQVQPYPRAALRARIVPGAGGQLRVLPLPAAGAPAATTSAALYEADVPGFGEHEVICQIPFATLDEAEPARMRLRDLDYATELERTAGYWRDLVAAGATFHVPDRRIDDFAKAAVTHVAITVDRDPASGLYMVPAATYNYGTCGNEACLQIRQLDWRGYHERARVYLKTFLKTQGWRGLDGRFRSQEGVLRGLDVYGEEVRANFNYNLDHGFIMRQLAEHYWLTRDRAWAGRWAEHFVAACDFIARERRATQRVDARGECVPEYGLLPAGHLEDNREWRHWYAVNAWACGGLRDLAAVLAEIDHPEAGRLQREAEAYRADILASLDRARRESPVVRLRDGTAIPHTPTRVGLHGRGWGWFREGAYGPLHLVDNDLLDPSSQEVTWILKDLEDNVFVSRQYGRPVDLDRDWFSQGGVAIQANLLNNAVAYVRRGQPEHAVRAFFNNLAASLYRDVPCFIEHPVVELGHGVGPFYKTPDECGCLNWLRQLLIYEEGTTLHLAWGTPRSWLRDGGEIRVERAPTRFGLLSYRLRPAIAAGRIAAEIEVPAREAPAVIDLWLRHPAKAPLRDVRVEGTASYEVDAAAERIALRPSAATITVEARY